MIARPNDCDASRLSAMLEDSLDLQEQFELTEHLDHCERCQHKLEALTARAQWWVDTKEILSGFEHEEDSGFFASGSYSVTGSTTSLLPSSHRPESPLSFGAIAGSATLDDIDGDSSPKTKGNLGSQAVGSSQALAKGNAGQHLNVDSFRREGDLDKWIIDLLEPVSHPPTPDPTSFTSAADVNQLSGVPSANPQEPSIPARSRTDCLGQIGGMHVDSVVGQGGMGVVLRAHDTALHRNLAVKLLSPMLASNGAARQRFLREAQAAAAVVHPNIVPIYAVSVDGKMPYLVMPYIGGGNLQQALDQTGPMPVDRALSIGLQVAEGLAAAHAQGIVHRDIKPANLLLDDGGFRVLLTDFGLARVLDNASLTASGMLAGTPMYMSPEQARGMPVDQRSDIYSLGAVLYALVTGCPPVRGESSLEMLRRLVEEDPKPIVEINETCPAWFARLVERLMCKSIEDRVQSSEDACRLLRGALAHARTPHRSALPVELQPRRRHGLLGSARHRVIAVLASLCMIALCGFAFFVAANWSQTKLPQESQSSNETNASSPSSLRELAEGAAMNVGQSHLPTLAKPPMNLDSVTSGPVTSGPGNLGPGNSPAMQAPSALVPLSVNDAELEAFPLSRRASPQDPMQWESTSLDQTMSQLEASLENLKADLD